ncbi:MAG: RNA polymerase sigma factor [Planctomycetota bacterium]
MDASENTWWTLVNTAAAGDTEARETFAATYIGVVRAYLAARWRGGPMVNELDDAVQETFVECFREGGALQRVQGPAQGRFRTFLFAVARNVGRRFEEKRSRDRKRHTSDSLHESQFENNDEHASRAFDRAFAETVVARAAHRQLTAAQEAGDAAIRRVELLRLRFQDDLPIRDIAKQWNEDAAFVHHEYARAREEFRKALISELTFQNPDATVTEIEEECVSLLQMLE